MQVHESMNDKNIIERGFTLIELLVVIAILGILAAVVVFSVGGITDKGKTSACKTEVSTVQTALEAFYAQSNPVAYPAVAATADNAASTAAALSVMASGSLKFLNSPMTTASPSIAAGYRYDALGQYEKNALGAGC
jgi:prepilin-type N-terminal cleavage/methylation domain-containing protein